MRVYQVNVTGRFSTGIIANQIHHELLKNGHESRFAFGLGGEVDENRIETNDLWHQRLDSRFQRYTGIQGVFCKQSTEKIIRDIEKYSPDLIHLHNLHGNYIDYVKFLRFIADCNVPVVLTLHDCWAFTGGCFHFTVNDCYKWKTCCSNCEYIKHGRKAEKELEEKRELFGSIPRLTVVTVSNWLKSVASDSIFKNRDITVIHNGIDTEIFSPKQTKVIRSKLHCDGQKVLLGVASTWGPGKGMQTWGKLAQILSGEYLIVLVGLNDRQRKELPHNIIGLPRVQTHEELAKLYSLADVYINMSLEETFGLPTIEAMACGTPAVVFRSTANPELIVAGTGAVCDSFDAESVADSVATICAKEKNEYLRICRDYAVSNFSMGQMTHRYLDTYKRILSEDMPDE